MAKRRKGKRQPSPQRRKSVSDYVIEARRTGKLSNCVKGVRRAATSTESAQILGILRKESYDRIASPQLPLPPEPLDNEIVWATALLIHFSKRIQTVREGLESAERHLIHGNKYEALECLSSIESESGSSLCTLSLRTCIQSPEENIRKENPNLGHFLWQLCCWRYHTSPSAETFRARLDETLGKYEHPFFTAVAMAIAPETQSLPNDDGKALLASHSLALIDRYELLISHLQYYVSKGGRPSVEAIAAVDKLSQNIRDPRLENFLLSLGHKGTGTKEPEYLKAYTRREYSYAQKAALEAVQARPQEFLPYLIFCKARFYAPEADRIDHSGCIAITGIASECLEILCAFVGGVPDNKGTSERLSNLSIRVPPSNLSRGLLNEAKQLAPESIIKWPREPFANIYTIGGNPRLIALASYDRCSLDETFEGTSTMLTSALTESSVSSPDHHAVLCAALSAMSRGEYQSCLELCEKHGISSSFPGPDALRFNQLAIVASLELGGTSEAIDYCLCAIERGVEPALLPTEEVISQGLSDSDLSETICLKLLRVLVRTQQRGQVVNRGVEKLQRAAKAETPAGLLDNEVFTKTVIEACSREVLDWNIYVTDALAVARERIAIISSGVGSLTSEDDIAGYKEEQRQLTEYIFRREAEEIIAETRIYVPWKAIQRISLKKFSDFAASALAMADVQLTLLDVRDVDLEALLSDERSLAKVLADQTKTSYSENEFLNLFSEILEIFCWDHQYGLNWHLSMTIRHGTLLGQLRAPFQESSLITERKVGDGEYERNTTLEAIYTWNQVEPVHEASEMLSQVVSTVHDEFIGKHIQVRSDTKKHAESALFNFVIDSEELRELWRADLKNADNPERLIEGCIEHIGERLENSLVQVREQISNNLSRRLNTALDDFEQQLLAVISPTDRHSFQASVTQSRAALESRLQQLEGWFSADEAASMKSFSAMHLLKFAFDEVSKRFYAPAPPEIICPSGLNLLGGSFIPLYHVLQILIDNAYRHSGTSLAIAAVTLKVTSNTAGGHDFTVQNSVIPTQRAEDIVERIENEIATAASQADIAAKEGGSGFPKILNMFSTGDLGDGNILANVGSNNTVAVTLSLNTTIKSE